jgi:hypothetical protein
MNNSQKINSIQTIFVSPNGERSAGPVVVINDAGPPEQFEEDCWDQERCAEEFHRHLRKKAAHGLEATMRAMDRLDCWLSCFDRLLNLSTPDAELGESLLRFWVTYGFHIEGSLKGNPIFVDALRRFVPPYLGPAVTLYRGELHSRHLVAVYGMAWTSNLNVAEMFARRRADLGACGVVLQIDARPEEIVCVRPAHSDHLGEDEYIVDPRLIHGVEVLQTFPSDRE